MGTLIPGFGVVRHVAVRAAADLLHQVPSGGEEEERGADGVGHRTPGHFPDCIGRRS